MDQNLSDLPADQQSVLWAFAQELAAPGGETALTVASIAAHSMLPILRVQAALRALEDRHMLITTEHHSISDESLCMPIGRGLEIARRLSAQSARPQPSQ